MTLTEQYTQQAREARETIALCEARMATCKPRARFAYASQITKAESKLARAERELQRLGRAY